MRSGCSSDVQGSSDATSGDSQSNTTGLASIGAAEIAFKVGAGDGDCKCTADEDIRGNCRNQKVAQAAGVWLELFELQAPFHPQRM